jgi:hypothetical protein
MVPRLLRLPFFRRLSPAHTSRMISNCTYVSLVSNCDSVIIPVTFTLIFSSALCPQT